MQFNNIRNFVGGWFVGDFEPTMLRTDAFEVSLKRYPEGAIEALHFQQTAIEFSVIISGRCRIGRDFFGEDEIVRLDPLEAADFEAITDVVLVAIKTPSIPSDKKLGEPDGY